MSTITHGSVRRAVHLETVSKWGTRCTMTSRSTEDLVNVVLNLWVPSGVVILPDTSMASVVLRHLPEAETAGPCVNVKRPLRNMV